MNLIEFYRALLPGAGNYALFSVPRKRHLWCGNLDKLVELTTKVNAEHSWYFATAAFGELARKQENVTAKRCFYFDIDCGPEKFAKHPEGAYPTQADGIAAVVQFAKTTKLIPTFVVSSGAGLHVYFALDEDITEARWTALAGRMAALAAQHGLRADPACTTDSARVLRPLGALHKNGSTVTLLKSTGKVWGVAGLTALLGEEEPTVEPTRRAKLNVNDSLQMWEPTPASAMKAAEKCAALRRVASLQGDVPEPEWRAMLGVVKFSVEGADLAHEWSCGYDGYSERETQEKFDRYEGTGPTLCKSFERINPGACGACEHRGKISSPLALGRLTDRQVEQLPPEKKPQFVLAEAVAESNPYKEINEYHHNQFSIHRVGDGPLMLFYRKANTKKGEGDDGDETVTDYVWEPLSKDAFTLDRWTPAGHHENDGAIVSLRVVRGDKVQNIDMPTKLIGAKQLLMQFLADRAISCSSVHTAITNRMHEYVNREFNRVKGVAAHAVVRSHFGLQYLSDEPNAELVAAQGRYLIRADATIEEAVIGKKLLEHRHRFGIACLPPSPSRRWDASVWTNHIGPGAAKQVEFYRRYYAKDGYEAAQLAIMLSISSPLLVFAADGAFVPGEQLPAVGLTVSLYSSATARGKSSMQKAAAAAYGNPAGMVLSGSKDDATPVYQSALAAAHGTMPFFADEVTGNGPAESAALINRIANGSDRKRGDRHGNAREASTWALIGSVSTNIPQRELLAAYQRTSDALQMRLLELNCDFPDLPEGAHTEYEAAFREHMEPNFGALGALLHLTVLRLGTTKMQELLRKRYAEAAARIPGGNQRQRFLQRGMACVLAAHDILGSIKSFDVLPFDRETLLVQYEKAAKDAIDYAAMISKSPIELLRKMIADFAPNIIVTEHEGHRLHDKRVEVVVNERTLRTPVIGRRIQSTGRLYLSTDAINEWARENQCSYTELIKGAKAAGLILSLPGTKADALRYTLTRGTLMANVSVKCYCFNELVLADDSEIDTPNVVVLPTKENRNVDSEQAASGS